MQAGWRSLKKKVKGSEIQWQNTLLRHYSELIFTRK